VLKRFMLEICIRPLPCALVVSYRPAMEGVAVPNALDRLN
jgi:hypothetical protein